MPSLRVNPRIGMHAPPHVDQLAFVGLSSIASMGAGYALVVDRSIDFHASIVR